ncbi:hypothetical protein D9V32_02890 [Mycetocola tolaasinivorans]|uniref:DNA modification methylase n=1 Tax=Mycetocola tolaasinivorans TaxID=76635 RepID=A0A3L7AC83_9MICO|nr:hypothetical protein [Mycetocola tolaasinivorans]RLP77410.1 hypothetical protein D9V32_02890 [Mycetocola tolaasinivorans]
MKARLISSVVLAATVLVGTAGCNLIAPQATLKHYDASDGVSANVGTLEVRNALVISFPGKEGVLAMTVVNTGDSAQTLTVEYPGGRVSVEVAASGPTAFGANGNPGITLPGFTTPAGADAATVFQYGTETGAEARVPVLDSADDFAFQEYKTLTPTPIPSVSPSTGN